MGPGFESLKVHHFSLCMMRKTVARAIDILIMWVCDASQVRIPEGAPNIVSDINVEGPPVPIPNTEVKLNCAENT